MHKADEIAILNETIKSLASQIIL